MVRCKATGGHNCELIEFEMRDETMHLDNRISIWYFAALVTWILTSYWPLPRS